MMMRRSSALILVAASVLVVGSARGETADVVPPGLRACATVEKDSERLECYDRTIERLTPELKPLRARVTALGHDASGALIVDLDNGQQWRQTSGSSSPLLEVGHEVTITRAALNSFRMSTPSGRALKVKRVR
jgi:hypothetical protein